MPFRDRIIWITGASSGIGAALAVAWSRRGARLVLSARREDLLQDVRRTCERPDDHLVLPLDLTAPDTFAPATQQVLDHFGRIDLLVNNGGISQRGFAEDTDLAVDRRIMAVNYFGSIGLTKAVLPGMLARGSGRIVVVSSLVGKISTPGRSAYAASKHALHGYFNALRAEVADRGVGVTVICPGFVRTGISYHALRTDGTPHGRMDKGQAKGMDVEVFAARALRAVERGQDEVMIGGKEVLGVYMFRFLPRLFNRFVRKVTVT